jgi:glc operon protein GlcG
VQLTLAESSLIVDRAIARAEELNVKVSVAVCDAGGRLVAFKRMDGAVWVSVLASQGKALASVAFGRPSAEVEEWAESPFVQRLSAGEQGMVPNQGAIPVLRHGLVEGACGVSGATGEQDEDCARVGVAALAAD